MTTPTRPVIRYFGGKWTLAPWIITFFPPHLTYVEPFGGAASVLLRKKPAPIVDVYNDLDRNIVSLFRILRDPVKSEKLRELVELTPFSREEFELSYMVTDEWDEIEAARLHLLRAAAGFGASAHVREKTGFRSKDNRAGAHASKNWARWPYQIPLYLERLRECVIENQPAAKVIERHDSVDTLFYCDPPYMAETRGQSHRKDYSHEMTNDDHVALARQLHTVTGMVIVSGYASGLYDLELFKDWERHETPHYANGGNARTEVVWLNDALVEKLGHQRRFVGL